LNTEVEDMCLRKSQMNGPWSMCCSLFLVYTSQQSRLKLDGSKMDQGLAKRNQMPSDP